MKTPKVTADDERYGKLAKTAHDQKRNPAAWVGDEDIWEKAKTAASKTYDESDDAYWPATVAIYKNMGGTITKGKEPAVKAVWSDAAREASAESRRKSSEAKRKGAKAEAASGKLPKAENKEINVSKWEDLMKDNPNEGHTIELHEAAAQAHKEAADAHDQAGNKYEKEHHDRMAKYHSSMAKAIRSSESISNQTVKAADGEVIGKPTFQTLIHKVNQAIQGDARFDNGLRGWNEPAKQYFDSPWCLDILVPDDDGELCAVIRTNDGKTVKHYFVWDGEKVTMDDGESEPTESTQVYSKAIEEHEKLRTLEVDFKPVVQCHEVGIAIKAKKTWIVGEQVDFQWMPGGVHVITASYGRGKNNRPIRMAVQADKESAAKVQASFETIKADSPRRPPYGCVEHRAEERAFDPVKFEWRDEPEPAIYLTAEPSELGAKNVNGKIHTSFSPTFDTDADYQLLKCSECGKKTGKCECSESHLWVFPDGAKGSESNPASVTRIDAQSVGSLTNWPAFKEILPIAARQATVAIEEKNPALKAMSERRINSQTLLEGLTKQAEVRRKKNIEAVDARQTRISDALGRIKVVPETAQQRVERLWARMRSTGQPLQN